MKERLNEFAGLCATSFCSSGKSGTLSAAFTVQRWQPDGHLVVLGAEHSETVRAEPFDAIELRVGLLFGDDPDEP
jgi:hypothetical protein